MSQPPPVAPTEAPDAPTAGREETGWHALPERARPVFVLGELPSSLLLAGPLGAAGFALGFRAGSPLVGAFAGAVLGLVLGLWLAARRFRWTAWRLDAQGLAVRRGRLWQQETRVPATRVQHLDLTRGPLQRSLELATLVIDTAGSRHGAVSVPDLDLQDAEQLREQLGRQLDDNGITTTEPVEPTEPTAHEGRGEGTEQAAPARPLHLPIPASDTRSTAMPRTACIRCPGSSSCSPS